MATATALKKKELEAERAERERTHEQETEIAEILTDKLNISFAHTVHAKHLYQRSTKTYYRVNIREHHNDLCRTTHIRTSHFVTVDDETGTITIDEKEI